MIIHNQRYTDSTLISSRTRVRARGLCLPTQPLPGGKTNRGEGDWVRHIFRTNLMLPRGKSACQERKRKKYGFAFVFPCFWKKQRRIRRLLSLVREGPRRQPAGYLRRAAADRRDRHPRRGRPGEIAFSPLLIPPRDESLGAMAPRFFHLSFPEEFRPADRSSLSQTSNSRFQSPKNSRKGPSEGN